MNADAPAHADAFGVSHVGMLRKENEDHFVVATLRKTLTLKHTNVGTSRLLNAASVPEALLLLVADGVGGNEGGGEASSDAVTAIVEYLALAAGCFNNLDVDHEHEFMTKLEVGVRLAHQRIAAVASQGESAPATTLTMALLLSPRAYIVHVGDSRAMFLRNGRLRVLTRDQTLGEELMDAGALTPEQAARSRFRDQLTSALGGSAMTPSIGLVDLIPNDVLLLCSDGLTKHVSDDRIASILGQAANAEQLSLQLVVEALAGGGTDNVSVVVARILA